MTKNLDAIGSFKTGFSIANAIKQQQQQDEQLNFLREKEAYQQQQDLRKIQQEEAKKQLRMEAFNNPSVLAQLYATDPQEGKSILEAKEYYNNKAYQGIESLKKAGDKQKAWTRVRSDLSKDGVDVSDISEDYSPEVASQLEQIQGTLMDPKSMLSLKKQMADIELAKAHAEYYRREKETGGGSVPAALQIVNEYDKARKEGNTQRMNDILAFTKAYDKGTGITPEGTVVPLAGVTESKTAIKQAEKLGTDLGEAQAKAKASLGAIEDTTSFLLGQIDQVISHPGKKGAVGLKGGGAVFGNLGADKIIPGSNEAGFVARMKQIEGQAFLQGFERLKGAGQITEIEGVKATQAITRMSTATSEKEFDEAAKEFREVVKTGLERARKQAKGEFGEKVRKDPTDNPKDNDFSGFKVVKVRDK